MNRKHFDFLVYMIDGSHLHADNSKTEEEVLESSWINGEPNVGEPNGSGIDEKGLDKRFVGNKDSLNLLHSTCSMLRQLVTVPAVCLAYFTLRN